MEKGAYQTLPGGDVELTSVESPDDDYNETPVYVNHEKDARQIHRQRPTGSIPMYCLLVLLTTSLVAVVSYVYAGGVLPFQNVPDVPASPPTVEPPTVEPDEEQFSIPEEQHPKYYPGKRLPDIITQCPSLDYYNKLHKNVAKKLVPYCDSGNSLQHPIGPDECLCENPTLPLKRTDSFKAQWEKSLKRNEKLIESVGNESIDVLLLGDSIVEHFLGTDLSNVKSELKECHWVYEDLFQSRDSRVSGLALGIGGDRIGHLLYRIENGELDVDAKIVWFTIGTNDLGGDNCNIDIVVAGIIGIAERMLDAGARHVVLNSILPRGGHAADDTYLPKDRGWAEVVRVNKHLECYVSQRASENLEFFSATELFLKNPVERNETLYVDSVHPSAAGYRVWGNAIVDRIIEMIGVPDHDNEEPVDSCPSDPKNFFQGLLDDMDDQARRCGSSATCDCPDPRIPLNDPQVPAHFWDMAFQRNKAQLAKLPKGKKIDVLFFGDSITEMWLGTVLASSRPAFQGVFSVYNHTFADMSSVVMGIAGDESTSLLYRIQNGELPSDVDVSVIWLLIGTNDLNEECSAEAIAAGNIAIVDEIRARQPSAKIVINSLLPRSYDAIPQVNRLLQCYAKNQEDGVTFFDADQVFLNSRGAMQQALFLDGIHPNEEGFREWGEKIHETVSQLLESSN